MTNEALVTLIQQGRSDLVPVLWFQVERFIAQQANHWTLAIAAEWNLMTYIKLASWL